MTDSPPKYKTMSRDISDKLIRGFIFDENGKDFHPISFSVTAIDGVVGIGDAGSAILLRSGVKIAVAMAYEDLEEKIYAADSRQSILNLCAVTGEAAREISPPHLQKNLSTAAQTKTTALQINAYLRKESTNEFISFTFSEASMASAEPTDSERSKSGYTLRISFNTAVTKGPFGTGVAYLDMPQEDFLQQVASAKFNNQDTLDLCKVFADNPKKYGVDL